MPASNVLFYTDQLFDKATFPQNACAQAVFENCSFKSCDFTGMNFFGSDFIDAVFDTCNFSMAKFPDTGLKNVNFMGCKLTGADLSKCKDFLFSANFEDCILDYTSFYKKKNKKSRFINCSMKGADFTDTDLTEALLQNCNLELAVFSYTILTGANLTSSFNFRIDPEKNQLKKARFSVNGLPGLLNNYGIIVER